MNLNTLFKSGLHSTRLTQKLIRVMKITTLLMIIGLSQVSAAVYSQQITLKEKNVSLDKALKDIKEQSGYQLFYEEGALLAPVTVSLDLKQATIEDALIAALKGQQLDFKIIEKTIVIKKKEESYIDQLKDKLKAAMASVTVKGQVTDATNQPMAGVNVREKGTQNVVSTDNNGKFSITLADNNAKVVFSYIGYETKELSTAELPSGVVITLKAAENNLQEVVISKGYYDEKRELSTGDVSVVSAKIIEEQPVTDPLQALEGRVPGLVITQGSGLPGANETVLLRGQNSINSGNAPLYVIDGVPFSSTSLTPGDIGGGALGVANNTGNVYTPGGMSPFNALNPDDIENIEVLKDADATAIYGSRGANGVILITTKKGKAGTTRVDVDFSQGAGQVAHFMNLMNTQQYLAMRHQAFNNDAIPFPSIANNPYDGNYDVNGVWDTTRNTNWQKVLLGGTAHYSNAQISVSGGTENTTFYVGGGFSRQTTVFPGDYDDAKGSLHFSLTHTSTNKRFELQLSGGYVNDNNNLPQVDLTLAALTLAPDAPSLYNPDGSINWQPYQGHETWQNPVSYLQQSANAVTNNLTSNLQLSYLILPGLYLKTSAGYGDDRLAQTNIQLGNALPPPLNTNPFALENNFGNTESTNWIIEPQLSYTRKIANGQFNALIGASFQQATSFSQDFNTRGYSGSALVLNPANASIFSLAGEGTSLYRYNAVYARVGYTWENKYLLNLTANRDGSSSFGPGRQWGNFGAIGVGWVFSKEKLIEDNLPWLNFGKLRVSYGTTGNDQITPYQYLSSYSTDAESYQGYTGLYPSRIPNPDYAWEVNKKLEGGIEVGFLQDRIHFEADYYRNRSSDQLINYSLPYVSGFSSVEENFPAIIQNTGAEFTLNTVNVKSGGFRWSTNVNLSFPNNKLVSFPGLASSSYGDTYVIGQSLFIQKLFTGSKVNPADGVYEFLGQKGYTENPVYPGDLMATAPITQKWYGGIGNSFSYKNFELDVFFQFAKQLAYSYWSSNSYDNAGAFNNNEPVALIGNTWTATDKNAKYGQLSTQSASDPNRELSFSDFDISNANYIQLKNLALSYSLPKSWQQALNLQNLRVYIQGQNMLTITNYFGLAPGGSGGLPPLRMITLGIHASL